MKISSHNHWDPLEEIIVGRADNARVPTVDASTMSMCYTNHDIETIKPLAGQYPQRLIDEANEDMEALVSALEQCHVKVHRPEIQDNAKEFSTP